MSELSKLRKWFLYYDGAETNGDVDEDGGPHLTGAVRSEHELDARLHDRQECAYGLTGRTRRAV